MQTTQKIRWRRVLGLIAIGFIGMMILTVAYDHWRKRNGWCVRFYPDDSQKVLYGTDCQKPQR